VVRAYILYAMRVVSLAVYVPVPYAAQRFAALGAHVTAVEPPGGDPLAAWCPGYYAELRGGQQVRRIDLKTPDGRAAFGELLGEADLLITGFRLSALRRLGLDWERLSAEYPRLSCVALVGAAATDDARPTHDLMLQAWAGLVSPPSLPSTLIADLAAGEQIVSTGLSLLLGDRPGFACVSLEDAVKPFAAPLRHGLTAPGAMLGGGQPSYRFYQTSDGWIAVAAVEPHFWSALVGALGEGLDEAFAAAPALYWEQWAAERGIPLAAVRDVRQA
jgi:alpha-methylacyl-CoA racemase